MGGNGRFPPTDYCFHSGFGHWDGGYFSPYDGEDRSDFRNFYNLGRQYRLYMVVTVVKLLSKGRP